MYLFFRFTYLIQGDQPLPDDIFNASSYYSDAFLPKYARLNNMPIGSSGKDVRMYTSVVLNFAKIGAY